LKRERDKRSALMMPARLVEIDPEKFSIEQLRELAIRSL
jgi:hypothetical protein